jgi:glycosyltransferase involved in cell wall biosynthesis
MGAPVITIILPTFNRIEFLERAILSVQKQTLEDWELLIVDDCSTEDIKSLVLKFDDPRVRFLQTPANGGPSVSRNHGIKNSHAASRFIALLDDDDAFHPRFLEVSVKALGATPDDIGFSWTGVNFIYPELNKREKFFWDPPFQTKEEAYHGFLEKRLIGTSYGILFKKKIFEKTGYFDESIRAVVDTELFLRILQHYFYIKIPDVLYDRYIHEGEKVSRASFNRIKALNLIVAKNQDALRTHPRAWYNFKIKILNMHYTLNEPSKARTFALETLKEMFSLKFFLNFIRFELRNAIRKS